MNQSIITLSHADLPQIDSAAKYYNEAGCGNAIRASGIPRDQIFFTTKAGDVTYEKVKAQVDTSLAESNLEYIDLMLLHNPFGGPENRKGGWRAVSTLRVSTHTAKTNEM